MTNIVKIEMMKFERFKISRIQSEMNNEKEPVMPNTTKTTINWYVDETLNIFLRFSINIASIKIA